MTYPGVFRSSSFVSYTSKQLTRSLYNEFKFLEVVLRLLIPCMICISTSANSTVNFSHQASQDLWPLPRPLISELTMVRALRPVNASPDWKLSTVPEMESLKRQKSPIYSRLCQKGPASVDQGFSTASQGSCHVQSTPCWNPPTSPYPTFKPIFKTDSANW